MVPTFDEFILPTLQYLADGKTRSLDEIRDGIIDFFKFSPEDLNEKTRSGNNTKVIDRITWALTYLCQAGLAERPKRAYATITYAGLELLENPPKIITRDFLYSKYSSFKAFHDRKKGENPIDKINKDDKIDDGKVSDSNVEQKLSTLRSAIASLKDLGLEPTEEMLLKEKELLSAISTASLFPAIAKAISENHIDEQFVLMAKYDKGKLYLSYQPGIEPFDYFPTDAILVNTVDYEPKSKRKRRPNLNFHQMGLVEGDILTYADNDEIQVMVASENKVEYNGKEYSLTKLTQELKGLDHSIQPTGEWLFDGQNLLDLYNETYDK